MTVKVGLKRMEFEKSKANMPLIDEAGAIDALVKALAGDPGWPIGAIEQITEGQYVQAK